MATTGLKSKIKTGGPSPELKANILSYFSWQWMQPFVAFGNKQAIQMEDIYDLVPREKGEFCERMWQKCWDGHIAKTGKPPSVWKLFYTTSGREMIYSILACPIWLLSVIAQVFVLKALVETAESSDKPIAWWRGLVLVVSMLVTTILQSIGQHYTCNAGQRVGMKIKAAMSMAVFNKLMSLKVVALSGTSAGQMLNLLMNDSQKIIDAFAYFGFTCFGVLDSALVAALAVMEIGVSALPGVFIVILAQFVQVSTAQGIGSMRKSAVKLTDARIRTVQEILSGVRVVKYNGWTTAFLARIEQLRSVEIRWIQKGAYIRASNSALREGVSPVAALATFATYMLWDKGTFSASKAFTILGLYNILVRVYLIAPIGAQAMWETHIAMKRLQQLLDLPEGNSTSREETMKQIRKICPGASLAVSKGTFSWYLENGNNAEGDAHVAGRTSAYKSKKIRKVATKDKTSHKVAFDNSSLEEEETEKAKKSATLKNINMTVSKGQLNAVIGSVGSGKSSILHAILGEMEILEGGFVMDGTVSYAPQQPWIINNTIKNNILFSSDYDETRYHKTISACALDHDIETMPAGDDTEIGERGVNLSGGQKARVSLARACYSKSKVVLLDDPLAAVDVPTAMHLMENVLNGVLRGRTVILVTHNKVALELCDKVFLMQNGELKEVGFEEDIIQDILQAADEAHKESPDNRKEEANVPEKDVDVLAEGTEGEVNTRDSDSDVGHTSSKENLAVMKQSGSHGNESKRVSFKESLPSKGGGAGTNTKEAKDSKDGALSVGSLTVKEDRAEGVVTWKTYLDFCKGSGLGFWTVVLFLMGLGQSVRVMTDFWIAIWVSQKFHLSSNVYLWVYAIWVGGWLVCALARALFYTEAAVRAAKSMHRQMAESVLRSPQLFFDQNPVGRIMNRFGKDQSMVDELLPWTSQAMFENLAGVVGAMILVAIIMPYFLISLPPFMLLLWYCQKMYMPVSLELKRLDGLSRSPIYAHFSQVLSGVTSVRAYGVEKEMHDHFRDLIDTNHRVYVMTINLSRWLGIRLDFAAAICLTTTAFLSILLRHKINPGYVGVVLIQSLQLSGFFQYGVRLITETENIFTSVERNQAYCKLPSEANPNSPPGLITDEWPEKGTIDFVDYTMTYRVDLQPVLNNLTFTVQPQEKVGIVGRTGAGKSSLAAALFRMVENSACTGSILIDGIDIQEVGLDDLRLRLSIIPQDPILFRGTVRLNLDPFHRHTDIEIHEALQKVELKEKIKSLDDGLDSTVTENGENFSVGQRQLLCLARSLLRKSKIIVIDEATAAVDGETDQLIQKTMKTMFQDRTVLTIAHRIDTVIDCDRVLVLAPGGRIVEFDSPLNLLRNAEEVNLSSTTTSRANHVFANMVSQGGPKAARQLREAAEAAAMKRQARDGGDHSQSHRKQRTRIPLPNCYII